MSVQLISWAYDQRTGSATAKAVLLSLANASNHHTGRCDPDLERIAHETEVSYSTVQRALATLAEAGLISRIRKRNADGSLGTYSYSFPHLDANDDAPPVRVTAGEAPPPVTDDVPTGHCDRSFKEEPELTGRTPTAEANASAAGGELYALRPRTAQHVVADVVDAFAALEVPISNRHRGMLGKQAAELLNSGFDYEAVVLACATAARRGEPQNAHFIAGDLVMARAGQRIDRRAYERALQDEVELAQGGRRGAA